MASDSYRMLTLNDLERLNGVMAVILRYSADVTVVEVSPYVCDKNVTQRIYFFLIWLQRQCDTPRKTCK